MTTDMNSGGKGLTQFYLEIITMTPSLLYQTKRKNPLVYTRLIRPEFFSSRFTEFFFQI